MKVTLLICLVILLLLTFFFYKKNKDSAKLRMESNEKLKSDIDVKKNENMDLTYQYDKLNKRCEDLYRENKNLKESYRLGYVFDKNIGEIKASQELCEIFDQLKVEGNVKDFIQFDNLFLYDLKEPRQIDHMVICDYGIYIFETKYWEGDIYYNISKDSLKDTEYELLNRYIFHEQSEQEHQTFVLKLNKDGHIEYHNHGNPYKQIYKTMNILKKSLNDKYFINSIVYFNYHANKKYKFINGTDKNNGIIGVNQKEDLYDVLKKRINNFKYSKLKTDEIQELKQHFKQYKLH